MEVFCLTSSIWGGLQDVFRNPSHEFKEEILTYSAFLKSCNAHALPNQVEPVIELDPKDRF